MSLETEELLTHQQSLARVAGAIAHELNNPLQGILSLVTVCRGSAVGGDRKRLEQIHQGLVRLSHVIASLSAVYENLPRPAEPVAIGDLVSLLTSAFDERGIRTELRLTIPKDTPVDAMAPELVQLIREAFSLPSLTDGIVYIDMGTRGGHVTLTCERSSEDVAEDWNGLDSRQTCSGLAVLIDEMTRLAGGKSEFRFDHASLSGIRLCFRTRMN